MCTGQEAIDEIKVRAIILQELWLVQNPALPSSSVDEVIQRILESA